MAAAPSPSGTSPHSPSFQFLFIFGSAGFVLYFYLTMISLVLILFEFQSNLSFFPPKNNKNNQTQMHKHIHTRTQTCTHTRETQITVHSLGALSLRVSESPPAVFSLALQCLHRWSGGYIIYMCACESPTRVCFPIHSDQVELRLSVCATVAMFASSRLKLFSCFISCSTSSSLTAALPPSSWSVGQGNLGRFVTRDPVQFVSVCDCILA